MTKGFIFIVILTCLVLSSFLWVNVARPTKCYVQNRDCNALEGALLIFFDEYSQWPVTAEDGLIDHKEVLPLLLGEKSGSLNQNQNPQGLKFLELDQASYIDGVFVDAWGNPYSVVVDSDYDGFVKVGEHMVKKTVVAWSLGPNGINEFGLGDDISSYDFASE